MISDLPRPDTWVSYLDVAYKNSKFSNFGELSHSVEARVAKFLGVSPNNVVTCANATLGLTGSICTAPANQFQWTIPSWTFTATASAINSAGKSFFFSDVDAHWRISPPHNQVNVVDVLPFGDNIDLERISDLCKGELIIDAAASFDALRFSNLSSIKRRIALVISFHPTKFPPGPEGAVFFSNDIEWVERFRLWTIFGMDERRESYFSGTNAKINEFTSAIILASLDVYEQKRKELLYSLESAQLISEEFGFELCESITKGFATPYWIIKSSREKKFSNLSISTRRWWMFGCHRMPAYQNVPKENLAITEKAAETSLGLPMFIGMSQNHWDRIQKAFTELHHLN
jgi:dTDP-4-amino-4,6-dideoxygalactose transaminase